MSELNRHSEAAEDFARSVELTRSDQGRGPYIGGRATRLRDGALWRL